MGVRQEFHRRGIGRALVEQAEKVLHHRGVEYVEVKTIAPSKRDTNYDRTRDFYAAMGFRPVEENNLWGDVNPCLIMIKHLSCQPPAS
jgi:predicted N-acetyltransferase YhbS